MLLVHAARASNVHISTRLWLPSGQGLATSMAQGLDIRFGRVVQTIQWGGETGARVTCENGDVFEGDAVIVSVSLGVLKVRYLRQHSTKMR